MEAIVLRDYLKLFESNILNISGGDTKENS